MSEKKIRVLIVDDSAVVRQVLTQILSKSADIDVIGSVSDPIFAMAKMNQDWPDVVVLDVEMPRMDGITFLKKIMSVRPTPVVICSTLTEKGAETTMQALSAGATGIVTKPKAGLKSFLEDDCGDIVHAVKAAAMTDMRRMKAMTMASHAKPVKTMDSAATGTGGVGHASAMAATTDRLVAIGTSTGGTQALEVVLTQLSRIAPGIVIVQHMPEKFTGAFAARLNSICEIEVKEAVSGDRVIPGRALIAPGGKHMSILRSGAQYVVEVQDGPLVNRHRPSVDVLFRSVAKWAGKNAFGIIMTGMGDDGARGLKEMHSAGARTAGQDEKTCVVYGMPREAVKLGAVQQEVPLQAIAGLIEQYGK
ncbi:chemotaxis response regulator protein-glutamate methylesterase [Methylomonas sp. EFPC3]|uniref:protein-glutamate methylesterase/protein-glutamine glutaminase n=1 Tax=unclassified Methylomonas TaxID=2608980 RepID=UPI002416F8DE|nr:chemotaxis response regulator protein-glutamate methylesterase [Methylomonas sp. EFPC3]WFP49098.1 chemotaxis response regulator protein-glutamate methylesterase [Methylomonas sp. EFPC3]